MKVEVFFTIPLLSLLLISSCEKDDGKIDAVTEDVINERSEVIVYDSDSLKVTEFLLFEDWHDMQGGAIYKDKLVCLMATDERDDSVYNGFVYDLNTGKKDCDLLFNSVLGDERFAMPHANQVSFGNSFYNTYSDFPLLYVSQVNGGTGKGDIYGERGVLVYDLRKTDDGNYTPVLVQLIAPDIDDAELLRKIGYYTPNYIIDTLNSQFVVIGYPNNSWFDLDGPQPLAVFVIPSVLEGDVVNLTKDKVIDSYLLEESIGPQQSFIQGRKIYSAGGCAGKGTLRIIDLDRKEEYRRYNLFDFTKGEPQFVGIWNGHFLYYEAGNSGIVYEFHFKN